jgi:AcrR family transcriptional regulator
VQVLREKPGTKRPAIVAAATSLFARRGVDATSLRDLADAAGVREAAIYRHSMGKEDMAQEIFASWYGWYG